MKKNIAVIRGDGIGPEIVNEAIKVLDVIAEKYGHTFVYTDAEASCGQIFAGRLFEYTPMPARIRRSPFSGRMFPGTESHFGPPTAPKRTLSAARHLSSSLWGRGSPYLSMAQPPMSASV